MLYLIMHDPIIHDVKRIRIHDVVLYSLWIIVDGNYRNACNLLFKV